MATNIALLRTAAIIHTAIQQGDRDYAEECAEDYRQGHRPHYCRHGANMWVDYDCVCSACEMQGEPGTSPLEIALTLAREAHAESDKRVACAMSVLRCGTAPQSLTDALIGWCSASIESARAVRSR